MRNDLYFLLNQYLFLKIIQYFLFKISKNHPNMQTDKQSWNENKKDQLLLMEIESLEDYIRLKTIANELRIAEQLHIWEDSLSIPIFSQPIIVQVQTFSMWKALLQHLTQTLSQSHIRWQASTLSLLQKQHQYFRLQSFDKIIFGGSKWSLLKTNHYYDGQQHQITDLFPTGSFKVTPLKQGTFGTANKNGRIRDYIIENVHHQQSQSATAPVYSFLSLIKLQKTAVINLVKVVQYLQMDQKQVFRHSQRQMHQYFAKKGQQLLSNLLIDDQIAYHETFLMLQYQASSYLRIVFNQGEQLCGFIKKIYSMGLFQALEWNFDPKQYLQLNKSQFARFKRDIQQRMALINKDKWPDQESPVSNQKQTSTIVTGQNSLEDQSHTQTSVRDQFEDIKNKLVQLDLVKVQADWPTFCNIFDSYLQNWKMKSFDIRTKTFEQFIKILYLKIQKFKVKRLPPSPAQEPNNINSYNEYFYLAEHVLPNIKVYLKEFMKKLKMTDKQIENIKIEQVEKKVDKNLLDKLLEDYLKEIWSVQNGQGYLLVKLVGLQKKPLRDFIYQVIEKQQSISKWQDIFNLVTMNVKNIITNFDTVNITRESFMEFKENIQYEGLPSTRCLGCTQFFYLNNVVSRGSNTVRLIPFVSKIKDYQSTIKEYICDLLNNNGGIILFNCSKEYGSIFPSGTLLTQKDKEGSENQITNLLSFIYPKPELSKNIFISFIPIMCHPLYIKEKNKKQKRQQNRRLLSYTGIDEQLKKNQEYYEYMNIEGLYVARIKVVPTDKSRVYIWRSEDEIYHLSGFPTHAKMKEDKQKEKQQRNKQNNSKEKIQIFQRKNCELAQLRKIIKMKFSKNLKISRQMFRSRTFANPLGHQCLNPNSGVMIRQREQNRNVLQSNVPLQDAYNHVSMLVVKPKYHAIVHERLTAKGVQCQIEVRFQTYKFKTASNTAILYHNQRFEEVLHKISYRTQFQFQGKPVLVISITNYLRIQESNQFSRIANEEVLNVSLWLKEEFPREELRFYELRRGRAKEYYLKTESKVSTLFMYYLLNGFKRKTVFKNPPNLDRMTEQQKREQFIEIHYKPRNGNIQRVQSNPRQLNSQSDPQLVNQTLLPKPLAQSIKQL